MEDNFEKAINTTMCLLIANPHGLPLSRFLSEYSDTVSETFPYQELGFKTPLDCLRSFNHSVNVINIPHRNDPLLVAIPENEAAHVMKFATEQKCTSKQSKKITIKEDKRSIYRNFEKQWISVTSDKSEVTRDFRSMMQIGKGPIIKLNERESQLDVPKVDIQPQIKIAELVPNRSNQKHNVIEESLDDNVPKTLDELKKNIKLLMSRHPEGIQLHLFDECYQELFCHTIDPNFYGVTNLKGLLVNLSPFIKLKDENLILACEEDVEEKLKIALRQKLKALKKRVLSICEKHRETGVLITQLSDIHEEIYDIKIKPSDFSFANLSEMLWEFRDEIKLEESEKGRVIYEYGYRPKWMKRILVPHLPASVQNRIETVLKLYRTQGIFMDMLEFCYKRHFKTNFALSEWGYASLEDLVNHLQGKILTIGEDRNGRLVLHYLPMAERDPLFWPIAFDSSPAISDWAVPIPEGVVHPLAPYKPSKLPQDLNESSEIFLTAGEIISPGKFYFQFADENQKTEFEATEYEMNDFYCENYQKYLLPKDNIVKGMVVAASHAKFWHRAKIFDPNDLQNIKLFCFDYGTYIDACLSQICYLQERYYIVPAQGHIGCLAYIGPLGEYWDPCASDLFLDWFKDKALFAYVIKIEETDKSPIVHLEVHYTHDALDFCVNTYLVEKNYACMLLPNKNLELEAASSELVDQIASNIPDPVTVQVTDLHHDSSSSVEEEEEEGSTDQDEMASIWVVPDEGDSFSTDLSRNGGILSNQAPLPEIYKFKYEGFSIIPLLGIMDGYFIPARYLVNIIPSTISDQSALRFLLLNANSEVEPISLKLYDKHFDEFLEKLIRHKVLDRKDIKNGYLHLYPVESIGIILNELEVKEPKIRRLFSSLVKKVQELQIPYE